MDGSLSRFCHKIYSESTGVKGIELIDSKVVWQEDQQLPNILLQVL